MVIDATLGLGRAYAWELFRARHLGLELRAGPAIAVDTTGARLDSIRFHAGVVHERYAIGRRCFDPINAFLGDPKGTN